MNNGFQLIEIFHELENKSELSIKDKATNFFFDSFLLSLPNQSLDLSNAEKKFYNHAKHGDQIEIKVSQPDKTKKLWQWQVQGTNLIITIDYFELTANHSQQFLSFAKGTMLCNNANVSLNVELQFNETTISNWEIKFKSNAGQLSLFQLIALGGILDTDFITYPDELQLASKPNSVSALDFSLIFFPNTVLACNYKLNYKNNGSWTILDKKVFIEDISYTLHTLDRSYRFLLSGFFKFVISNETFTLDVLTQLASDTHWKTRISTKKRFPNIVDIINHFDFNIDINLLKKAGINLSDKYFRIKEFNFDADIHSKKINSFYFSVITRIESLSFNTNIKAYPTFELKGRLDKSESKSSTIKSITDDFGFPSLNCFSKLLLADASVVVKPKDTFYSISFRVEGSTEYETSCLLYTSDAADD